MVCHDRALNHMSKRFQGVMKDISRILKPSITPAQAVLVPGSGTFGMEAVARQFATGKKVMVIRNGWFSYRWTQILEMGRIPAESTRAEGAPRRPGRRRPVHRRPSPRCVAAIRAESPAVVFAPHVETAAA